MILDTHTHFYDPSRPQGVPWPRPSEAWLYRTVLPPHYRSLAEPLGIVGTVVVEASSWVEDNQWLLDLARQDPFLLGVVGNLDPRAETFLGNLERFARHPRFRGIRCGGGVFATGADGLLVERLGALARHGLTLDVLAGSTAMAAVAEIARHLPALRLVVNHLAVVPIDGGAPPPEWVQAMQTVAAQPGVFMKVSAYQELSRVQPAPAGLPHYQQILDVVWDAFGPERLVYGSDWPVCERAGTLATGLDILRQYLQQRDPAAAPAVLGGNACRAYGIVAPAPSGGLSQATG